MEQSNSDQTLYVSRDKIWEFLNGDIGLNTTDIHMLLRSRVGIYCGIRTSPPVVHYTGYTWL